MDIYDNPWFYYNDAGWPADLVTALRMDRGLREEYEAMTEEERLGYCRNTSEEAQAFEQSLRELDAMPDWPSLVPGGLLT